MNLSKTQSGSANVSSASISTTAQVAVERNDNREGLIIFNDSDQTLLVGFGDTVDADTFTLKLLAGGYYESGATVYVGPVRLVWSTTGTGQALITELEV